MNSDKRTPNIYHPLTIYSNKINRNNSTVQKSWTIIEPQQFAEEFSIAIVGHSGWDKNLENEIETNKNWVSSVLKTLTSSKRFAVNLKSFSKDEKKIVERVLLKLDCQELKMILR